MRVAAVLGALLVIGCGGVSAGKKLGESCSRDYPYTEYNGNCESVLFCSGGTCHNRCSSSIRCPAGCTCDLGAFSNFGPCTGGSQC